MSNYFQNPNGICEDAPCCGCCGMEAESFDERENSIAEDEESAGRGWPGELVPENDHADHNADEGDEGSDDERFYPSEEYFAN